MAKVRKLELVPKNYCFDLFGLKNTAVFHRVKDELLPSPVSFGHQTKRFLRHEVDAVHRAYIAGASEDEIRSLVRQLKAKRAELMPALAAAA